MKNLLLLILVVWVIFLSYQMTANKKGSQEDKNIVSYFQQNIEIEPSDQIFLQINPKFYYIEKFNSLNEIDKYNIKFNDNKTFEEEIKIESGKIIFKKGKYEVRNNILRLIYQETNNVHDIILLHVGTEELQIRRFGNVVNLYTKDYDHLKKWKEPKGILAITLFSIIVSLLLYKVISARKI